MTDEAPSCVALGVQLTKPVVLMVMGFAPPGAVGKLKVTGSPLPLPVICHVNGWFTSQ